jgi:hypothetical protein
MECAICYEKFYTPKTHKELKKIYKQNVKNDNFDDIMKFKNLLVTANHNETHVCSTPNCNCVICRTCWIKITEEKYDKNATMDDFRCPYCRNIDWKDYMKKVLNELQEKVLGKEEFEKIFIEKVMKDLYTPY